jgi:DNA-binding MarR family transcriptional regulator
MRKTIQKEPIIPQAGEGKRGQDGHIGYLLRQAQVAHRQRMERALSTVGLTPPQFAVLTMLVAYPGASGADIARLSLLTPQTVSVIVGNLERMGALARTHHATHGRILQMEVTGDGRQLLARCRECVAAVERELLKGLSPAHEAILRKWLVHVATLSQDSGQSDLSASG